MNLLTGIVLGLRVSVLGCVVEVDGPEEPAELQKQAEGGDEEHLGVETRGRLAVGQLPSKVLTRFIGHYKGIKLLTAF